MDEQKPLVDLDGAESVEKPRGLARWHPGITVGEVETALCGVELTGWHSTRLLNAREVTENGLRALGVEDNLRRIDRALDLVGLAPERKTAALREAADLVGRAENRRAVHFCAMERDIYGAGFYKHAWSYGGEALRWVLEGAVGEAEARRMLAIGEPWAIKVRYPFAGSPDHRRTPVAGQLLACLNGEDERPRFQGYLLDSVPAEAILEVRPLEIPRYPE